MAEQLASSLVGKVADSLLTKVKKEIGYMRSSKENVEKLRREAEKLKVMKERVEQKIKLALDNGDELVAGVEKWVNEADAHKTMAEEFLQEEADAKKTCFNLRMCVNLNSLHHYGKEATNKVSSLEQHQKDGAALIKDGVSTPAPVPGIIDNYPRENIVELDTHKSLLENITQSVLDENIQITGIYGIGGVGKTTLATEVAAKVKDLFAHVEFVTISQHVDAASIKTQVEIAAKRIHKKEKVLIIMDDVWTELKLHDLGIPCGKTFPSCKILLTSRSSRVCTAMDAQAIICVESLPFEEAWVLFKRVVGERVETDALKKVAEKVVIGCGGLPLILNVVGKALKNKDNFVEWEDALVNIAKDETSDIGGALRVEFARLKLSYDYLESEQVKLVFLLCSMFPEDFNVPLESLAYYCVGLQIFTRDLHSLEAARNKVKGAVNILKSSCLLLDGNDEFTTKMHDVVRDVALLIASTGDNNFLVEARKDLTEWQPRNGSLESYTGISLIENDIRKLPDYELNIPRLKIFLMQGNIYLSEISDEFTQAMEKVEVIDFECNDIRSLPKSLNQLTRLRMLNLRGNRRLCDVSILGELEDLEILILSYTGIKKIPQEIGKIVKLRLFHAVRCRHLSHIAPGVLSKLRWLEELRIGKLVKLEGKDDSLVETGNVLNTGFPIDPVESPSHGSTGLTDGSIDVFAQNRLSVSRPVHGSIGRFNPSFKTLEIGELGKLTYLHLWVPHICLIPEGDYQKRLKTFCIKIGGSCQKFLDDDDDDEDIRAGDKTLILETLDDDISHLKHVRKWIEVCNAIVLRSINNLDKIMPMMYCEGFGFKTITIGKCANLLYLVDSLDEFFSSMGNHEGVKENILSEVEQLALYELSSLKVIWNCADEYISLKNLVTLIIFKCPKLEKLFSVSVAQGLFNLKELGIGCCDSLKEVISDGDGETSTSEIDLVLPPKNIVFHRLTEIKLFRMESLTSFYPGNATIEYPSFVTVEIDNCDKLEKWGNGTHHTPKLQFVEINRTKVNGSIIDETLAKYREAEELKNKEEGLSFVYSSSEGEE